MIGKSTAGYIGPETTYILRQAISFSARLQCASESKVQLVFYTLACIIKAFRMGELWLRKLAYWAAESGSRCLKEFIACGLPESTRPKARGAIPESFTVDPYNNACH